LQRSLFQQARQLLGQKEAKNLQIQVFFLFFVKNSRKSRALLKSITFAFKQAENESNQKPAIYKLKAIIYTSAL